MALQGDIAEVNNRLAGVNARCRVEQRRASLALRATLPPKPGATGAPRQQRIPLGLQATKANLDEAEMKALSLAAALRNGSFNWDEWMPASSAESTLSKQNVTAQMFWSVARKIHEAKYANQIERGREAWRKRWSNALSKLPEGELTPEILIKTIENLPPGSAVRKDVGGIWGQVAKRLGWDPAPIREAGAGYSRKQITPRDIPSDSQIEQAFETLHQHAPHWAWVLGMCAIYGCRPSELGSAELRQDNSLLITNTKTSRPRVAMPTKSEWIEKFDIHKLPKPPRDVHGYSISTNCNAAIRRHGIGIRLYDCRHAAAIRLLRAGVPSDIGAKLLGHSVAMFNETYARWISEETIAAIVGQYKL